MRRSLLSSIGIGTSIDIGIGLGIGIGIVTPKKLVCIVVSPALKSRLITICSSVSHRDVGKFSVIILFGNSFLSNRFAVTSRP